MKFLFALLLIPFLIIPAYAESQTLPTEQGTLDVKLTHDPIEPDVLTKMNIDFINPQTQKIQIHIDYSVAVSKDGETVFGPTNLIHTSEGSVKIPIEFKLGEGVYSLDVEVEGILFNPIPPEAVSFDVIAAAFADHSEVTITPDTDSWMDNDDCIGITYGCYTPGTATVDVGGVVIFSNTDSTAHTMTSGSADVATLDVFNSNLIKVGESWTLDKELEAGEYPYFCMVHPWANGLLIVQEAEAAEEEHMEEVMEETEEEVMEETEEEVMEETEEEVMEETEEEVMEETEEEVMEETTEVDSEGGGCLIATATFGSELAPQVQQLRELRDNTILSTESGTSFMTGFNQFYYSFSPAVADLERESPIFKEMVKIGITPLLSSLSIMEHADSESEVLGYGIGVILMNLGMYIGIPAFGILKLYQFKRN